ncbi:hypothetical protein WJX74_007932 [Apatococcus lobatus]|uniref:R3H domain-containing protein n=1 Tax=Apatococcus lobatus TaxID=904363 RepID=A0AAW1R2B3_9CHLO
MPGGRNRKGKPAQKYIKPVPPPPDDALGVQLVAPKLEALPDLKDSGLTETPNEHTASRHEAGKFPCSMENWTGVSEVVKWFGQQLELDDFLDASLIFSSKLGKDHRAFIHSVAEHLGKDVLRSESHGVGDDRHIALVSATTEPPQKWLDPSQDHKAKWLYIWAKEAGLLASRDELAEMLATNSLTPPLAELWKRKTREQKLIERLCKAAADGDLTALQVACEGAPDIVKGSQMDVLSGARPLHTAAGAGQAEATALLLQHGAPVDGLDGHGHTALQVSRRFEQCDSEGVLLRAGASDLRLNEWLDQPPKGFFLDLRMVMSPTHTEIVAFDGPG